MTLAAALAQLQAGDRAAALASACEAWRGCRDPRLAATIDALAAELPTERPAGKTLEAKQAAWKKAAKQSSAAQLGGLLASLTEIRKAEPLLERIWGLEARPHDPRIAAALVAMIESPPILGGTFRRPLATATKLIADTADVRQLAALDRIATEITGAMTAKGRAMIEDNLGELRNQLVAAVAKHSTELPAADLTVLAQIDAELAARATPIEPGVADTLFAAVYADPEDDGPRLVLADELQRRGDPRGELIALQLARGRTGTRTKRERELLAAAGRDWLGVLEPVIAKTGVVFERGFLSACAIRDNDPHVFEALADRPEWRTLEDVDLASAWIKPVPVARMSSLRVLRNCSVYDVPEPSPHLERLELRSMERDSLTTLSRRDLPMLRHIACGDSLLFGFDDLAEFWRSDLARRMLSFAIAPYKLDGWLPGLFDQAFPELTLSQRYNPWSVTFHDETATLRRQSTARHVGTFDGLREMLRRVPPSRFPRIVLEVPGEVAIPDDITALLAEFREHVVQPRR